jgi:teichuronic acid biosynthesis glycosyltransferase TuaC
MSICKIFAMASNHPDPINEYWALFIKWSIEAISRNGVDVKAIIPRPYAPPISKYSNIPKYNFNGLYPEYFPRFWYLPPKRIFYSLAGESYSKHVSKFLKNNFSTPDLVHAHHVYLDGYGVLKYCKSKHIPLIVSARGTIEKEISSWRNIKPKIMNTLEYSSKILCVSNDLARIIEEMGISKDKILVIPSGTNIERFNIEKKLEFKNNIAKEEHKIILFVGQLTEKKGIITLIKDIEIISKKYHNRVKFVIVGEGKFKKKLKKINNVIVKGNLSPEKTADLFVAADIFVLPSFSEGRPNVIYEAMASECAVVASNVGGIPEQIEDGYNGFLLDPKDHIGFAEKLIYLLDNEDKMSAMGKNGRKKLVENDWTWDNYAKRVIDVYKDLL